MSSEPLTRDDNALAGSVRRAASSPADNALAGSVRRAASSPADLDAAVEADDPLAGLGEPDDLDDAYEEEDAYEEPAGYDDEPGDYLPGVYELGETGPDEAEPVLLVWPADAYEQVDQRWPEVLEPIGAESWDEYRRYYQALIVRWERRGLPLSMVAGTADGFADWLDEQGADPLSADLVGLAEAYGHYLADQVGALELPPAGADPCWCGSALSYARCCQLLTPG